jgi:osmotically inducible protein OsmC
METGRRKMTAFNRSAESVWEGDLKNGAGKISTSSGVLSGADYQYATRFENKPGTNPEELIAAAHAGCFNMALASTLKKKGFDPKRLHTTATCTLASKEGGGFEITRMHLKVSGSVDGIDESDFVEIVEDADRGCPVSNLLRSGLQIEKEVALG